MERHRSETTLCIALVQVRQATDLPERVRKICVSTQQKYIPRPTMFFAMVIDYSRRACAIISDYIHADSDLALRTSWGTSASVRRSDKDSDASTELVPFEFERCDRRSLVHGSHWNLSWDSQYRITLDIWEFIGLSGYRYSHAGSFSHSGLPLSCACFSGEKINVLRILVAVQLLPFGSCPIWLMLRIDLHRHGNGNGIV